MRAGGRAQGGGRRGMCDATEAPTDARTGVGGAAGDLSGVASVTVRVTFVPQPACLMRALPVASSLSQ